MRKVSILALFSFFLVCNLHAQTWITFADSCYFSAAVGTSFNNSADLVNNNADLMSWDPGTGTWTGSWASANLYTPPPDSLSGCRAIFAGNGQTWTTGGEGFGILMSQPLVTGQTYQFGVTYVSDGFGSNGAFAPFVYTSSNPNIVPSGTLVGSLPPAGYTWLTSVYTFTATAGQNGDTWLMLFTGPTGTSGIINSFCLTCQSAQPCSMQVNLGNDTAICAGQQVSLNAQNSGASYLWSDGETSQTIAVSSAGSYWVHVSKNNCAAADTIAISTNPSPVINLNDTSICSSAQITLNAGNAGAGYLWSDGETTGSISVSNPGSYWVRVSKNNCTSSDTLLVVQGPLPVIALGDDTSFCYGSLTLDAGNPGSTYLWSTGATTQSITVNAAGNYHVTVTNPSGCSSGDSISLIVFGQPQVVLDAPAMVCPGDTFTLCAPSFSSYAWSNGQTSQCFTTDTPGSYYVNVQNRQGCAAISNTVTASNYPVSPDSIRLNGDTMTSTGIGTGVYQWLFNNAVLPGDTGRSLIATQTGNYTVEITDSNGCHHSAMAFVTVLGVQDITTTGQLRVYPNPLGNVNWRLAANPEWLGAIVTIFDINGKEIYRNELTATEQELPCNASNGVYVLRVETNAQMVCMKLIKL